MSNFITNTDTRDLRKRLIQLISKSNQLKFLVGFFYFSGLKELYECLKQKDILDFKVLVGLNVDKINRNLVEIPFSDFQKSDNELINEYFNAISKSINTDEFDNREFFEQVKFFLQLIRDGKLKIRKTREPNHSKLYLFYLDETGRNKIFITGSSNLTKSGLLTQNEFNVEISDYGFESAEKYFDTLWDNSIQITEDVEVKSKLIEIIQNHTHVRKISPFEAFILVLKSYLETYEHKDIGNYIIKILEKNNYKVYRYQLDAIKQALAIIENHNGVLIADVVGLGKTIIACAVAKSLRKRGIVICPPGLIGDKDKEGGWVKYLEDFELYDWEVRSLGELENILNYVNQRDDIEVVIIDEAHRFRNEDTLGYELLKNICRNKIVILLTATPFNNKPSDVLSLLKLFITPKKSTITLDNNLLDTFRFFGNLFEYLSYINRYYNSKDIDKQRRAQKIYTELFDENHIDLKKVKAKTRQIAREIREVIEPVTIRRNRLDLLKHPEYKNEVKEFSKVKDPIEWFYELSQEQSKFYDDIISFYFEDPEYGGKFNGAIYRPFEYEKGLMRDKSKRSEEENREYIQQRNLFDIMRRLLIKRFESSFGAFEQSIRNFKNVTEKVLKFITKTGNGNPLEGDYILDRELLEKIVEKDVDEIEDALKEYEERISTQVLPKKHKRYKINTFVDKDKFIEHIKSDIALFDEILNKLNELSLVENDPKSNCVFQKIAQVFNQKNHNEPLRKVVIFSEYADTVNYLKKRLEKINPKIFNRSLFITGNLPERKWKEVLSNFDASYKEQKDDYDLLITTDKLSEGFNLNRAGMVINYDIPWNPVRVIQRLGRINRISKKVFDELYIVNFFPTEQGADYIKSREIAQTKMFMIHNTLGEDSKIFDIDEEPSPANLYTKLMTNPDELEEESFYTKIYFHYDQIRQQHPEIIKSIKDYPKRIKVAKSFSQNEMIVFFKKNKLYVKRATWNDKGIEVIDTTLEEIFNNIICELNTPGLEIDDEFWRIYEEVKTSKTEYKIRLTGKSLEIEALNKINFLLRNDSNNQLTNYRKLLRALREDILDYGTLPDYTIRRIANLQTVKFEEGKANNVLEELEEIYKELGDDYLEKEKERLKLQDREIIIAIQNVANKM